MKKAVLVVEDDPGILESMAEFLDSEGYLPQMAQNGRKALDLLAETAQLPGAIILDLMMPVMDGIEFSMEQKKDPRIAGIPVILVSADHQLELKRLKIGPAEVLRKPIDIDRLSAILKRVMTG